MFSRKADFTVHHLLVPNILCRVSLKSSHYYHYCVFQRLIQPKGSLSVLHRVLSGGKVPREVPYFLPLLYLLKSDPLRASQKDLDPSSDRNRASSVLCVCFVVSFCPSCQHHTNSLYHGGICSGIHLCKLCSHSFWSNFWAEAKRICIRTAHDWKWIGQTISRFLGTSCRTTAKETLCLWPGVTRSVYHQVSAEIGLDNG